MKYGRMKIKNDETKIVGKWIFSDGKMFADEQCERIQWLTTNYLKKIGTDKTGWEVLFQDPDDNRFWERIYPDGEMHGGGPASLILLTESEARDKYTF